MADLRGCDECGNLEGLSFGTRAGGTDYVRMHRYAGQLLCVSCLGKKTIPLALRARLRGMARRTRERREAEGQLVLPGTAGETVCGF